MNNLDNLKILEKQIPAGYDIPAALFLDELDRLTTENSDALSRGFRCTASFHLDGEPVEKDLRLDVQAACGGGSFAIPKRRTLEAFPKLATTGNLEVQQFLDLLECAGYDDKNNPHERRAIAGLENLDQMRNSLRDWTREIGVTHFLGGFRVRFGDLTVRNGEISRTTGEYIITFSGGSGEQDLSFGLSLFKLLDRAIRDQNQGMVSRLDLAPLRANPFVNFYLKQLGIDERNAA